MWAAGLALAGSVVAYWRVARPGFIRLTSAVVAALGVLAAWAGGGWWGLIGAGVAVTAFFLRVGWPAVTLLGGASLALLVAARTGGQEWVSVLVGAASLGGISGEMLLGHWFLVDPKLPRLPLRRLAYAGIVGASAETIRVALLRSDSMIASPALLAMVAAVGVVLMVAVVFSLRVRSYTGVMAATGLSYLATITALAVAIISRPA